MDVTLWAIMLTCKLLWLVCQNLGWASGSCQPKTNMNPAQYSLYKADLLLRPDQTEPELDLYCEAFDKTRSTLIFVQICTLSTWKSLHTFFFFENFGDALMVERRDKILEKR